MESSSSYISNVISSSGLSVGLVWPLRISSLQYLIVLVLAVIELNFFIVTHQGLCFGFVLIIVPIIPACFSYCWTVLSTISQTEDTAMSSSQQIKPLRGCLDKPIYHQNWQQNNFLIKSCKDEICLSSAGKNNTTILPQLSFKLTPMKHRIILYVPSPSVLINYKVLIQHLQRYA